MERENIRVLIVDDEERFRETTAKILTRRGFEVIAVGNGILALEEVKANGIDVVVLDIKMPGMDGNEALREIRKIKPELPVIMLTGHGTPASALEGIRDGVFDYLSKPCSVDVLARKITEACLQRGGVSKEEPRVKDIMVPLSSFSRIRENRTVFEAIGAILEAFNRTMSTSTVQETAHRSILVMDKDDDVIGIITFTDLLQGLQPQYMRLLTERLSMADSISLESPAVSGMFTIMTRDLTAKSVHEVMSDAPPVIDGDANLMEAVDRLLALGLRRLLVQENGKIVGVIREQDLFFEIAIIIRLHETLNGLEHIR